MVEPKRTDRVDETGPSVSPPITTNSEQIDYASHANSWGIGPQADALAAMYDVAGYKVSLPVLLGGIAVAAIVLAKVFK